MPMLEDFQEGCHLADCVDVDPRSCKYPVHFWHDFVSTPSTCQALSASHVVQTCASSRGWGWGWGKKEGRSLSLSSSAFVAGVANSQDDAIRQ